MNIGTLTIEMAANVVRIQQDMDRIRQTVDGTMAKVQKAASMASTALGALGVGLSAGAFASWIKSTIDMAEKTNEMSQKIGVAVKDLAGLQLAFQQGGVDAEEMKKYLAKMTVGIMDGNSALKAMGIATRNADGSLMSTRDVIGQVADRFASYEDGVAKTALAIELFGKGSANIIPVLNAGGASIAEFDDWARKLGITLSEETAQAAERFNDKLELASLTVTGLGNQMMVQLLPTLESLVDAYLNVATNTDLASNASVAFKTVLETIAVLGVNVAYVFTAVGNEIGGMAAQIGALVRGDFAQVGLIHDMMVQDAEKARAQVDKLSEAILSGSTATSNSLTVMAAASKKAAPEIGKASEEAARAAKKQREEYEKAVKAAEDLVDSIRFETDTQKMSNLEKEIAINLRKLEQTGLQQNTEEYRAYADAIRQATIENEGIKERIKLEKEAADKRKKIEEDWAREVEQINFQIGQSLTDALMNGGKTAKEFLIDMFKTLILRPILQPIITSGTGLVMSALGMTASGSAAASTGSLSSVSNLGSLASMASSVNNAYTALTSATLGALDSIAAGAQAATFAVGEGLASMGFESAGAAVFNSAGTVGLAAQGAAGIGAGTLAGEWISGGRSVIGGNSLYTTGGGAAAGAAIGTAIVPGIGTAIGGLIGGIVGGIANAAFGSGAKQLQGGQMASGTITATGVQDAQFYQNWKKSGGWFRSDQYGRDTQAMSQELVTYINDASQAIRDSGKDYATLLQLNAEGIDAVALSFNFAVGSIEELTENLGNTLDDYANKVADAILAGTNFGKAGETSYETIQRLVNSLNLVNPIFDTLGIKMFEMSARGGAAASAFIDLMGGMDQFTQATDFYYQNFYTQAERTAKTTENLNQVFDAMNVELPQTAAGFRALVEGARAAGNDQLLSNLLQLAPTFLAISAAAEQVSSQRASLTQQIYQLQGNTQALRDLEMGAMLNDDNRALQAYIYRLQDAQVAYQSAQNAVTTAQQNLAAAQAAQQEAERSAIEENYKATIAQLDAQKVALDSAKQSASQTLGTVTTIFNLLEDRIRDLTGSVLSDQVSQLGRDFIDAALASGTLPSAEDLSVAFSNAMLGMAEESYSTSFEMRKDRLVLAGKLSQLQTISGSQKTAAEMQLEALNNQLAAIETQIEQEQSFYEKQISALETVNASVLSVADATSELESVMAAMALALENLQIIQSKTPEQITGDYRTQSVTGFYQKILERDPEEAGLSGWVQSSLELSQIESQIQNSLENRIQEVTRYYRTILNRDPEESGLMGWVNSSLSLSEIQSAITASDEARNLRGFASGGHYPGGLAIVGERGPELINFSNPGMVYNSGQTQQLIGGGQEVASEVRALREENAAQARSLVQLQNRMTRLLERWDGDGMPETRMVAA